MDEIVSSNSQINNFKIQGSFKNYINRNNEISKKEVSATSHLLQNNINQSMDEIIGQSTLNAFEALHIKDQHRLTLKAATKPA